MRKSELLSSERSETVTLHLGESYDSGEIGLDYAYAMFRIEA